MNHRSCEIGTLMQRKNCPNYAYIALTSSKNILSSCCGSGKKPGALALRLEELDGLLVEADKLLGA